MTVISRDPLAGVPFSINKFQCYNMARRLREFRPSAEMHPWSSECKESQFFFKILFVSVCHQINWDFMQDAMADILLPDAHLSLDRISCISKKDIDAALAGYPKRDRWRSAERAKYLRMTASELKDDYESFLDCVDAGELAGERGFYQHIDRLTVFQEDDLNKKTNVLAHDLFREGVIQFLDPENLRPAVEYHLIRLYLRTGRVYPTHDEVKRGLLENAKVRRPRLVKVLRQTVSQAMELTSFYSGLDIATLNYLEWQIARNVCDADDPKCHYARLSSMPSDISKIFGKSCLFSEECEALNNTTYGMFKEPHFQKAIY